MPRSDRPALVEPGPESIVVRTWTAATCPASTHTDDIDYGQRPWPAPLHPVPLSATSRLRFCTVSNSGTLRSRSFTCPGTGEVVAESPLDVTCTRHGWRTTRSPKSMGCASRLRHELLRISRGHSLSNRLSSWAIQRCTVQGCPRTRLQHRWHSARTIRAIDMRSTRSPRWTPVSKASVNHGASHCSCTNTYRSPNPRSTSTTLEGSPAASTSWGVSSAPSESSTAASSTADWCPPVAAPRTRSGTRSSAKTDSVTRVGGREVDVGRPVDPVTGGKSDPGGLRAQPRGRQLLIAGFHSSSVGMPGGVNPSTCP